MHDAFQVSTVLDKLVRIESILAYGDRLLVGTATGQLMIYEVKEPLVAGGDEIPSVTHIETKKTFSKRPIEQLDIVKEIDVLVSLSDGLVSLHDLRTLDLRMQLTKTRGANMFAVETSIEMTQQTEDFPGIPTIVTRLAVAVKRKLMVYIWKDTEFADTKELMVSQLIKTMTWVGASKICLGFISEYALMDCDTGVITELFATSSDPGGPPLAPILASPNLNTTMAGAGSAAAAASTLSAVLSNSLSKVSMGTKAGKPMVTKLPNKEMLLAKDHVSIFLGLDGTPTRKVGIEWTGIPEEMGYSYPYVVAILPRHVEVRNIQTQTLVQQIELPSARLLNQGKLLYIASATQIWRLTPYSFAVQVDQLVEKNEFEEAISLLQQIEPILLENKPHATTLQEEKMRTIRNLHAHYLFQRNEFDAALALFQELDTDPIEVIQMYPPAISGRVLKPSTPSEDGLNHNYSDYASDGPDRDPDDDRNNSNPWSTIVNPWSTPATEPRRDSLTITASTNRVPSVLSTWFNPQHDPQPTPPRELTGQVLEEAINYLIRFLTDRRGKTAKLLYQQQQQQQAAQSSGRALGAKASKEKDEREKMDRVAEVAKLVDTVLLKAYMMTNDALVGPLLRVQNSCDVEECEVLLLEKKKYKELVDLYNGKGLHRKSLELLSKLGQSNEGPLRGCMPTIMYLQRLGQEHLDIILEYSEWVLRTAPEEGMKIFIKDAMDDQFSHARVLAHLEATSADLSIIYLEHVILELGDETTEFHNKLAGAYLDKVLQEMMEGSEGAEGEGNDFPSAISESRSRLIHFLNESLHYWPAKILARLQLDGLFEERAVLLSRIGQHEQALAIYVFRLRNYRMAEEYCNRIFRDDPDNGRRMYLILLRVYLKPSTKEPPLVDAALELLSRHGAHIDAEEVLAMLPVTTRMDGLFPFFEKYVRETNKNRNMNLVVKNLLEAERLQVQEQWVYYRSRAVKITEDRMCPQCNRRIGNSVFAVFPTGAVVHYSCKEKIEKTQWKLT